MMDFKDSHNHLNYKLIKKIDFLSYSHISFNIFIIMRENDEKKNINYNIGNMSSAETKLNELKTKIQKDLDLNSNDLPSDINISTITFCCALDTEFYPQNIANYILLSPTSIIQVTPKKNLVKSKKNSNKNKQNDEFQNQVTLCVNVSKKDKPISVKIFKNGSLHLTGCKNVDNMLEALQKVCFECSKTRAIICSNKIKEVTFAKNPEILGIEHLKNFKVHMINSNFTVPFCIDRPKLHIKLKSESVNSEYDTNKHAGVQVKFENNITIFVFESGSIIIIAGRTGFSTINKAYTYIYKYLLNSYDIIVKNESLTNSNIIRCLDESTNIHMPMLQFSY